MAMLAEPRSRQKWSEDPRNTKWANDTTKFGYQMMTRMGWSEGQGLGINLAGSTKHIGVRKKKGQHGVGATIATDDNWIAHQDDFNALLGALNQGVPCPEQPKSDALSMKIASLESSVKRSSKKIMYQKYVRGKDLSRASANDLASIFGQRGQAVSQSAPCTPQLSGDEASDSEPDSEGMHITTASLDMNEYFAEKMAAFKLRREARLREESLARESGSYTGDHLLGEHAKRAVVELVLDDDKENTKEIKQEDEVQQYECAAMEEETPHPAKNKKKKKKKKYQLEDQIESPPAAITIATSAELTTEANTAQVTIAASCPAEAEGTAAEDKKKKKKKKKKNRDEHVLADNNVEQVASHVAEQTVVNCAEVSETLAQQENADKVKKKKTKKKATPLAEEQSDTTDSANITIPHSESNNTVSALADSTSTVTADDISVETTGVLTTKKKKKKKKNKPNRDMECVVGGPTEEVIGAAEVERPKKRKLDEANMDVCADETEPCAAADEQSPLKKKKKKKKKRTNGEDA